MNLFGNDPHENLLPYGGTVNYFGRILSPAEAQHYYLRLSETVAWKNDEAHIYGRHFVTARKVAWYADRPFAYTYSRTTKHALSWTRELLELKERAEHACGARFNACLLNLYHNGGEGMAWHSDDEPALDRNAPIASLSLGAERKFSFKHKTTRESVSLLLENGSLLLMKDTTQTHWLHRLPPTKKVHGPRINLTFRTMKE